MPPVYQASASPTLANNAQDVRRDVEPARPSVRNPLQGPGRSDCYRGTPERKCLWQHSFTLGTFGYVDNMFAAVNF
jgi:hypothetical protein